MKISQISLDGLSVVNPFVSKYWAFIKARNNWDAKAYEIVLKDDKYQMLLLSKNLFLNYYIAYIPFSPQSLDGESFLEIDTISKILDEINNLLYKRYVFFKIDLPFGYKEIDKKNKIFKVNDESVQPEATIRINLNRSLDVIKKDYHKRALRHLKRNKENIFANEVEICEENVDIWYALYQETAKRDKFSIRDKEYIKNVLFCNEDVSKKLIFAYKDNCCVGGIIIIYSKVLAIYLFGASKKLEKYSPSYSMQDFAIEKLNQIGVKQYDLHGIGIEEKSPHLKSLTLFKTSFGGDIIKRCATIDYPINKGLYRIYKIAEKIRYFI